MDTTFSLEIVTREPRLLFCQKNFTFQKLEFYVLELPTKLRADTVTMF